jgi:2-C-methyl-D-erythritol 4-phosphate cytidylyltransferase
VIGAPAAVPPAGAVILADARALPPIDEGISVPRGKLDLSLLRASARTLDACPGVRGFVVLLAAEMDVEALPAVRASGKFLAAVPLGPDPRRSLRQAVEALPPELDTVLVHDLARALATPELFEAVLEALNVADVVAPAVPMGDTMKRVEEGVVRETVSREGLWMLQTPVGFRREALVSAERGGDGNVDSLADELWALQRSGFRVRTVDGEPANIRLSSASDLRLVDTLLGGRRED